MSLRNFVPPSVGEEGGTGDLGAKRKSKEQRKRRGAGVRANKWCSARRLALCTTHSVLVPCARCRYATQLVLRRILLEPANARPSILNTSAVNLPFGSLILAASDDITRNHHDKQAVSRS